MYLFPGLSMARMLASKRCKGTYAAPEREQTSVDACNWRRETPNLTLQLPRRRPYT